MARRSAPTTPELPNCPSSSDPVSSPQAGSLWSWFWAGDLYPGWTATARSASSVTGAQPVKCAWMQGAAAPGGIHLPSTAHAPRLPTLMLRWAMIARAASLKDRTAGHNHS